jgi:hypothetical protein
MSKDARNEDLALSPQAQKLMDELVSLVATEGFGEIPSLETTFADIEKYGHATGRMVARALDEQLVSRHSAHFKESQACPQCGGVTPALDVSHPLPLTTQDGELRLSEPAFRCPSCERDFFPSTHPAED